MNDAQPPPKSGTYDLHRIDLNLLTVFEAIYKTGSVSQGAKLLGMSQPAVSNALSRLRLHFSDKLFVRSDRGVKPTVTALRLAGPITASLNLLRTGLQIDADFDIRTANRHFRLIIHDFSVPSVLPKLLQMLDDPLSSCKIEVVTPNWTHPHEGLLNGDADIMLDAFPQETPGLAFEPLMDAEAVCIVREGHPRIGHQLTRDQFAQNGHAVLKIDVQRRLQVAHTIMSEKLSRREVCILPNASDLAATVATSDLIALVPRRYAELVAPIYRLRVLPVPFDYPKAKIFLGWATERTGDPGLRWIRNVIRSIFTSKA